MTNNSVSLYDVPLFLPGNPPSKLVLRAAEAVNKTKEDLKDELTEFVTILCRHMRALAGRFPDLRDPLAAMLKDVYAEARPT